MRLAFSQPALLYRPAEWNASAMICNALYDILINCTLYTGANALGEHCSVELQKHAVQRHGGAQRFDDSRHGVSEARRSPNEPQSAAAMRLR